jgi:predicted GH43/DUF377 family glycosyl hydrolase
MRIENVVPRPYEPPPPPPPEQPLYLTNWVKDAHNPIFDTGAKDWPAIVHHNGVYYLYVGAAMPSPPSHIRLFTSHDGVSFTLHPESPVVTRGPSGSWDDTIIEPHSIIWWRNQWRMYYCGYHGTCWKVGYAYSNDLVHWTKYSGNPVLYPTGDEPRGLPDPHAVVFQNKVFLYYVNHLPGGWEMRGAYSTDGDTFIKFPSNPIYPQYSYPCAFIAYGDYGILGLNCQQMGAHPKSAIWTTDGEHFTDYSDNPVFTTGQSGDFDRNTLGHGDFVKIGDTYWYYYSGYDGARWRIGRASTTTLTP